MIHILHMEADAFVQSIVINRGLPATLDTELLTIEESIWVVHLEHIPEGNLGFEHISQMVL